ncbi:MAG: hypothetical protein AUJ52_04155 [Elusimicrobia bacterium CG1_02_63_36]|nr:MAG: hypothetical protein AUJ52_04155 [Elusimicrobia bacterium CG1_02_63_36]PIP84126.1 MAG: hypothetical protein COR54_05585 [Elusimicrobia bacterium CG22_combo_CG10-13_8_21_14_all_63_91]PJA16453.1 MAG: hypothetical protein COX66_07610 [Elusimicrobia bacterium CG_4_10_14_0_2_um_filter_63_34]PJB25672.1 MAG: hypothetical protein CO113_07235 [Elusimicrobia bacterium CG_4_9_14_3_um_filter_62_55]
MSSLRLCPPWFTLAVRATAVIVSIKLAAVLLLPEAALELPSNYEAWGLPAGASWETAAAFLLRGGLLAPVSEEAIFRGALLGSLWTGLMRLRLGERAAFWCSAIPVSLLFVCLHETANPSFIWIRMVGALALAVAYREEGLPAAIAMHAIGNSFWSSLIIADRFFGPDGMIVVLAAAAGLAYTISRGHAHLGIASAGTCTPLRAKSALGLSLLLTGGSLLVGGSPLYTLAALGLLSCAVARFCASASLDLTVPAAHAGARP